MQQAIKNILKPFQVRLGKFFGKRMPKGNVVTLNQHSSYIWPTTSGYLLLGIIFLMMLGATNYQNNLAFVLTFLLIGIGIVSIILTFKNLQKIEFAKQYDHEFFVDTNNTINFTLKSLNGQTHSAIGVGWERANLGWVNVPQNGHSTASLSLKPKTRGYLTIPRIKVTSVFPFGWLRTWAYFSFDSQVLVYPKPISPPISDDDAGNNEHDEGKKMQGSDEFYGLKQYQQGEPLSRIDWKSFARERGLYVREFASFQSSQLVLDWDSFQGYPVESKISFLTFLILEASKNNLGFSLSLPGHKIAFDEGDIHRKKCLKALALFENKKIKSGTEHFAFDGD